MTDTADRSLHIVLTAGEASGDLLGAGLMRALRQQAGQPVRFSGVGGDAMAAEGLQSLFPMRDLSLMGVFEILPKLPLVLRRIRETSAWINREKPDIVVTIDSPDFSFRVARKLATKALRIHYVAPTVWAWRPERAAAVAKLYDGILCLLPFEPPYFTAHGMKAAFTGHPAVPQAMTIHEGAPFRERHGIPDHAFVLGLLLGSRRGEMARTAPALIEAVRLALQRAGAPLDLHIVAPTLPHLREAVEEHLRQLPCAAHVLIDHDEKWPAFASMDAALAVSGTVALELGLSAVPHVIAYRMNKLTYKLIRPKIKVDYAHIANILFDEEIVPEFIQDKCDPALIADGLGRLFNINGAAATAQRTAFRRLKQQLSGESAMPPSEQAATHILQWRREKTGA